MLKVLILALIIGALAFGGEKKSPPQNAQAVQKCLDGCTKMYDTCKKSAKSSADMKACEQSKSSCRAACNK